MATGNPFLDKVFTETGPTPKMGARRLVNISMRILKVNQDYLETVREIVARHTVAALRAELGNDEALALEALYTAAQALVTTHAPNVQIADIE